MILLILNEWRALLRRKVLAYLTAGSFVVLVLVTWIGITRNNLLQEHRQMAQNQVRAQWENIDAMNPHGAAHYGSYAFKPVTVLSSIDEGVNAFTGNVLRLEGHVQNEIVYSEVSQSLSVSQFGKIQPALILQFVIPLMLIFLGFASVSREKETGIIRLLSVQGISIPSLVIAKTLSIWMFGLAFLIVTVGVQVLFNHESLNPDMGQRLILFGFSYALYYWIISALTVYLSARLKDNTAALTSMLALWMLWTVFLPRLWGNTTDKMYPLPSRADFKAAMAEDRSKGIDGHNPDENRKEELKTKVLAEYRVESLEELPINFDGIVMQEDEEFGNLIWDKHFGKKYEILQKQKMAYQLLGLFNPFSALQSLSMGVGGSDMIHHVEFLSQSEKYRRYLIKTLNDHHAYGGSTTGDWSWTADRDFYNSIEDFDYQSPQIRSVFGFYRADIIALIFWAALSLMAIVFMSQKIQLL